jgi:hypothetical protein
MGALIMEYITVRQAAEKWSISMRSIQFYLKDSRIPGAIRLGRDWLIPKDAQKPEDNRKYGKGRPKKKEASHD